MNAPIMILVDRTRRGTWEVRLPRGGEPVVCPSLDAAVRVGHQYAANAGGGELVIHDAYHRVLRREFVSTGATKR